MNSTPASQESPRLLSSIVRLTLLIVLFVLELEMVEIALRDYYDTSRPFQASIWAPVSGYQRFVFSALFVFISALVIAVWPRLAAHWTHFQQLTQHYAWVRHLIAQLLVYGLFVLLTFTLTVHGQALHGLTAITVVGWALSLVAVGLFTLLMLAPRRFGLLLSNRRERRCCWLGWQLLLPPL